MMLLRGVQRIVKLARPRRVYQALEGLYCNPRVEHCTEFEVEVRRNNGRKIQCKLAERRIVWGTRACNGSAGNQLTTTTLRRYTTTTNPTTSADSICHCTQTDSLSDGKQFVLPAKSRTLELAA